MKLIDKVNVHETFGSGVGLESSRYAIDMTSKVFRMMIDDIYTDKVTAVMRELSANAYDAHVEAGNLDVPFDVHLPIDLEPWFSVRDYGVSMDHDTVMHVFTTLGRSTKTDSDDVIGAFGVGSKVGFAVADSFDVVAYLDGEERKYVTTLDVEGIPTMTHLYSTETDEPNGILVKITPSDYMARQFAAKAPMVYLPYPVRPTVNLPITFPEIVMKGNGWNVYSTPGTTGVRIAQGVVSYPAPGYYSRVGALRGDHTLVIDVPIGSVAVAASREALSEDEETSEAVRELVAVAVSEINDRLVANIIENVSSYYEAVKARNEANAYAFVNELDLVYKGRKVKNSIQTKVDVVHSGPGRAKDDVAQKRLFLTLYPGADVPHNRVFVIDRSDQKVLRRKLRVKEFADNTNRFVRVLHDPTPKALAQIARALRADGDDIKKLFVPIASLPDVKVERASRSAGVTGVYLPGEHGLTRLSEDPTGDEILVPISKGTHTGLITIKGQTYKQTDLSALLRTIKEDTGRTIVLLTPAAYKRATGETAEAGADALDTYVDIMIDATLTSRKERAIWEELYYGADVSATVIRKALGWTASQPTSHSLPYPLNHFAETPDVSTEAEAIRAKFPLLFQSRDEIHNAYIDSVLKEDS